MLKIDFYVQQFVRYSANAIELVSDRPVRFSLADGDRETSKPIDHAQVKAIVVEAAPPVVIEALQTMRRGSFRHRAEDGTEVSVSIDAG